MQFFNIILKIFIKRFSKIVLWLIGNCHWG